MSPNRRQRRGPSCIKNRRAVRIRRRARYAGCGLFWRQRYHQSAIGKRRGPCWAEHGRKFWRRMAGGPQVEIGVDEPPTRPPRAFRLAISREVTSKPVTMTLVLRAGRVLALMGIAHFVGTLLAAGQQAARRDSAQGGLAWSRRMLDRAVRQMNSNRRGLFHGVMSSIRTQTPRILHRGPHGAAQPATAVIELPSRWPRSTTNMIQWGFLVGASASEGPAVWQAFRKKPEVCSAHGARGPPPIQGRRETDGPTALSQGGFGGKNVVEKNGIGVQILGISVVSNPVR